MKWEQRIIYDIYKIDDSNSKNWFSYNDYAHHVDKDKYTPYNSMTSHIHFKCQPDSRMNLTRRIINQILEDERILEYMHGEIYDFILNTENDSVDFRYPYKNEIEPTIKLSNRVSGNQVIFTISASNINCREDILDGLIKILNIEDGE